LSYSPEDRDAIRAMLRRAAVVAVNDTGGQQLVDLSGFASDFPKQVVRIADFGFASNPPPGGEGLMACPGGRSDRAMFLGGEHAKYRPVNLPVGATAIYDAFGQILEFVQNSVKLVCTGTITLQSPTIVLDGAVQFTGPVAGNDSGGGTIDFGASTLTTTGDMVAGGVSAKTHAHGGVMAGGSDTTGPL
jgi:phage baseplate assembly protein V